MGSQMPQHDIGLVGLAVMGQNLVLNMANHGYSVGVYNRTTATTDEFVHGLKNEPADKVHPGTAERIQGYHELKDEGPQKHPRSGVERQKGVRQLDQEK